MAGDQILVTNGVRDRWARGVWGHDKSRGSGQARDDSERQRSSGDSRGFRAHATNGDSAICVYLTTAPRWWVSPHQRGHAKSGPRATCASRVAVVCGAIHECGLIQLHARGNSADNSAPAFGGTLNNCADRQRGDGRYGIGGGRLAAPEQLRSATPATPTAGSLKARSITARSPATRLATAAVLTVAR